MEEGAAGSPTSGHLWANTVQHMDVLLNGREYTLSPLRCLAGANRDPELGLHAPG